MAGSYVQLRLNDIFYSAAGISDRFHDGDPVHIDSYEGKGWVIQVVDLSEGLYFTLNNKLLHAHKKAHPGDHVVRAMLLAALPEGWSQRFSTQNGGGSVTVWSDTSATWSAQSSVVTLEMAQLCRMRAAELTAVDSVYTAPTARPGTAGVAAETSDNATQLFLAAVSTMLTTEAAHRWELFGTDRAVARTALGRVAMACKGAFALLVMWPGWTKCHHFVLPEGLPPGYSAIKLSAQLARQQDAAAATTAKLVAAGNATSGGGTAKWVDEGRRGLAASSALTRLYLYSDTAAASEVWLGRLGGLAVRGAPTEAQAQELRFAMDTLRDPSVLAEPLTDAALLDTVLTRATQLDAAADLCVVDEDDGEDDAAADAEPKQVLGQAKAAAPTTASGKGAAAPPAVPPRANRIAVACFLAHLVATPTTAAATGRRAAGTNAGAASPQRMCQLCTTVEQLLFVWALLGGVSVDELKERPFKGKPKGSVPRPFRELAFAALSRMPWKVKLVACDTAIRGLFKHFWRACHLGELLRKSAKAGTATTGSTNSSEKAQGMALLMALVHEQRYPASADDFDSSSWSWQVVEPLRELLAASGREPGSAKLELHAGDDPDHQEADWCSLEFQAELAGRRLPGLRVVGIESLLSKLGNCSNTWYQIFDRCVRETSPFAALLPNMHLISINPLLRAEGTALCNPV